MNIELNKSKKSLLDKMDKEEPKKTSFLMIYLAIVGTLIVIALVVLAILVYRNGRADSRSNMKMESLGQDMLKQAIIAISSMSPMK